MKHNYKLIIAYDGTEYSGWQVQPNAPTIQEHLETAAATILKQPTKIIGSGRTDAGVHALNQVAHMCTNSPLDLFRFRAALNGILPSDIRIKSVEEVPQDFHARYSATSKIYHYHLFTERVASPFKQRYALHIWHRFDPELLMKAAPQFIGTHDFTTFSNESHSGAAARNPVRTLSRLDVVPQDDGFRLEFEANGFLYKMVRNLTGCLLEVATKRRPYADIPLLLSAKDRRQAGKAAPAHPLFLEHVNYS